MNAAARKKFRLTGMVYDEVSLVDSGANNDAHVVLFKRDVSKGLLDPEDVHEDVPMGYNKKCKKRGHMNGCNCVSKLGITVRVKASPRKDNGGNGGNGGGIRAEDGSIVNSHFYDHVAGPTTATLIASGKKRQQLGMELTPEQKKAMGVSKAARKTKQMRGPNGRWMSSGGHVAGQSRGYFFISKKTRRETNQADTLSSGPRGENGGSWNESKYKRDAMGKFSQTGRTSPPGTSPTGAAILKILPNGEIIFEDGYHYTPGTGWKYKGDVRLSQLLGKHPLKSKGGGGGKGKGKGGGGSGSGSSKPKSTGKTGTGKGDTAPSSPVSPARKPLTGSSDKVATAQENAKAAHDYADQMKQWASDLAAWAQNNPSDANKARAERAAVAAQRAEYSAETADATVEQQKKAVSKRFSRGYWTDVPLRSV